nr:MAG TPA: hypothetical protein [Caudoviricetes sp.]
MSPTSVYNCSNLGYYLPVTYAPPPSRRIILALNL